jgi:accessory gene regulator protein AgrB
MSSINLVNFIEQNKNYDHISAVRAAYQTKIFIHSIIYMLIIAVIMYFCGLLPECLILFVALKLYRENAGGIHLHGYIKCFVFSLLSIGVSILLSDILPVKGFLEVLLLTYSVIIWYLYVPQGTSQRPIRKAKEKKRMKQVFCILIIFTFMIRFINTQIYSLVLWAMVLVLTFITPIVYKLLKVKHDRIPT